MAKAFRLLQYSVIRIEGHTENSESTGTGFLYEHCHSPRENRLFLVSNRHVVEGVGQAYVSFTKRSDDGEPLFGDPFHLSLGGFSSQWHNHPNDKVDISVMPISWALETISEDGVEPFIRPISSNEVADERILESMDISSSVLFVGYPNGMFDEKHYLPIARYGHIATPPDLDFNGQPVFLIDASVFPGSSGSPVFTIGDGLAGGIPALRFLGVVSAVFTQRTDGEIRWEPAPMQQRPVPSIGQMIDLGVVVKAKLVDETIEDFWRSHA